MCRMLMIRFCCHRNTAHSPRILASLQQKHQQLRRGSDSSCSAANSHWAPPLSCPSWVMPHHHHTISYSPSSASFKYTDAHKTERCNLQRERENQSETESSKMESSPSCSETEYPVPSRKKQGGKKKKSKKSPPPPPPMEESGGWPRRSRVTLEGYIEPVDNVGSDQGSESGSSGVGRTKSLTDEDLEELKGCLDLGFGFSYEEIPELCSTLPALELCYSMSQRFLDEQQKSSPTDADSATPPPPPSDHESVTSNTSSSPRVANWKISSPGDHPDEVKARLRYWAQAVACTVRLCS